MVGLGLACGNSKVCQKVIEEGLAEDRMGSNLLVIIS